MLLPGRKANGNVTMTFVAGEGNAMARCAIVVPFPLCKHGRFRVAEKYLYSVPGNGYPRLREKIPKARKKNENLEGKAGVESPESVRRRLQLGYGRRASMFCK